MVNREKMVTKTISLPPSLLQELVDLSERTMVPASVYVRQGIALRLAQEKGRKA